MYVYIIKSKSTSNNIDLVSKHNLLASHLWHKNGTFHLTSSAFSFSFLLSYVTENEWEREREKRTWWDILIFSLKLSRASRTRETEKGRNGTSNYSWLIIFKLKHEIESLSTEKWWRI